MFIKSVQAVGRDLTADKLVKQLQGASFESPMFYDKVSFQNGHLMPEAVEIDQVQKGKWTAVSKTLR